MSIENKREMVKNRIENIIRNCNDMLEDYSNNDADELYFTDKFDFIIRDAKEAKDTCYEIVDMEA